MDTMTKIEAIKAIRARTPMGLKEAKDALEGYVALHFGADFAEAVDAVVGGETLVRVRIAIEVLKQFSAGAISVENKVLKELEDAVSVAFNA